MSALTVIKRSGDRAEAYSPDKLHRSIHAACLSVSLPDGVARDTAARTVRAVDTWLTDKLEVTSADIRHIATSALTVVSPEAGYIYKHYQNIL